MPTLAEVLEARRSVSSAARKPGTLEGISGEFVGGDKPTKPVPQKPKIPKGVIRG